MMKGLTEPLVQSGLLPDRRFVIVRSDPCDIPQMRPRLFLSPLPLSLLLLLLVVSPPPSECSLMSIGGLLGGGRKESRPRPWDTHRNNYPQYYYKMVEEEEDRQRDRERLSQCSGSGERRPRVCQYIACILFVLPGQEDEEDEDGNKPCVGLCYYKKLKALEEKQNRAKEANREEQQEEPEVKEVIAVHPEGVSSV